MDSFFSVIKNPHSISLLFNISNIYYHDVVGVETKVFGIPLEGGTYGLQRFDLEVSNGRSVGVTTIAGDRIVEQTVHSLGALLRDKKYDIRGGERNLAGS